MDSSTSRQGPSGSGRKAGTLSYLPLFSSTPAPRGQPALRSPISSPLRVKAQAQEDPAVKEAWHAIRDPQLLTLRDLFRKVEHETLLKLRPDEVKPLLYTPNTERTGLMLELMKDIHPPKEFWIPKFVAPTQPGRGASKRKTQDLMDTYEQKFMEVSRWFGLTASLDVVQGRGTEVLQYSFWVNLIRGVVQLREFEFGSEPEGESTDELEEFSDSEPLELQEIPAKCLDFHPYVDPNESVKLFKQLTQVYRTGTAVAAAEIKRLEEGGLLTQSNIQRVESLPSADQLLSSLERIEKALALTVTDAGFEQEPEGQASDPELYDKLMADAKQFLQVAEGAKAIQRLTISEKKGNRTGTQ